MMDEKNTPETEKELFQYDTPVKKTPSAKVIQKTLLRKFMPVIILVAAAALLGGVYLWLRAIAPEDNGDDRVNTVTVVDLKADQIKTLTVKNGTDSYKLYKKAGSVYKMEGKEDKPVDEDIISGSIESLAKLSSTKRIMVAKDKLKEYGLAAAKATATLDTGKQTVTLTLGSASASGDYYYTRSDDPESKDGKTAVYLLEETAANILLADRFYYYETDLSGYDSSSDAEHITPVKIGGSKGTAVSIYLADDESGLAYVMEEPIDMPFSTAVMDEILALLTSLNTAEAVEDDMSAVSLKKYGLDVPRYTLTFSNNTDERIIEFGLTDKAGNIYCKRSDGDAIYQIAETDIAPLKMDVADMCDVVTYTRDVDSVADMLLRSASGKTYDIETEGKGDERVVKVNNKTVESSIFSEFYAYLLGIEVQRQGEKPQGTPYATLKITLKEGGEELLEYYAVDERYCYYQKDGKGMFYVSRHAVDTLIENAQKVYDNKEITSAW